MTGEAPAGPFAGIVYRAHNLRWSYAPTSGEGAARHGGRFNPRGVPALYVALDPTMAWMEAQPLTLVSYRVDCERVVDLIDPDTLTTIGISSDLLAYPWEDLATRGHKPSTWALAKDLIVAGHQCILVPSYAPGTEAADRNLVLWHWSEKPPCRVQVIDDFGRLPKDDSSWR